MLSKGNLTNISQRFLLALDIFGLNILDSIISRAREYYWNYIKLLSSFRLSWRRTAIFLRLSLFIINGDTGKK